MWTWDKTDRQLGKVITMFMLFQHIAWQPSPFIILIICVDFYGRNPLCSFLNSHLQSNLSVFSDDIYHADSPPSRMVIGIANIGKFHQQFPRVHWCNKPCIIIGALSTSRVLLYWRFLTVRLFSSLERSTIWKIESWAAFCFLILERIYRCRVVLQISMVLSMTTN